MSMSDAYTRCEELGIPTDVPDALGRLWEALTPAERPSIFPFARNYESPKFTASAAGPGGYVRSEPATGEWRMWNGTSTLVFQAVSDGPVGAWLIRYASGEEAFSDRRELYEASHVVMAPADNTSSGAPLPAKDLAALNLAHATSRLLLTLDTKHIHHDMVRNALEAYQAAPKSLPVRGRPDVPAGSTRGHLSFPPAENATRARELAAEHVRRARVRLTSDVPPAGRTARPGDVPRAKVLREAADTLAKLCAVYVGTEDRAGSTRNLDEGRAYALAFRLVEQSARRLAMRRLR